MLLVLYGREAFFIYEIKMMGAVLMEEANTIEERIVGYLGPRGTYSEEVALKLYKNLTGRFIFIPYNGIDSVIRAVNAGEVSEGVVPVENSVEGSVNITLDSMAHDVNLVITREIIQPIRNNLLVKHGTKEIKTIISHPQPLAQCRQYLAKYFPEAELKPVESTAKAAYLVASEVKNCAAIASAQAGEIYGLKSYANDIQDFSGNCTRFIVVQKTSEKLDMDGDCKTSLICRINGETPGSLCDILVEFAERNVNLTKIESRPARTKLGEYIFFFDIEGNLSDKKVHDAIAAVQRKSLWFKNLGSYPVFRV